MINRKASLGSGLDWIVATIIIVFVSFFFIAGVLFITTKETYSGSSPNPNKIEFENQNIGDSSLYAAIESLLATQIAFNNQQTTLASAISDNELQKNEISEKFNAEAEKRFSTLLPFPIPEWSSSNPWWARVYNKGDRMNPSDRADTEMFHAGGFTCDPNIPQENLVISYILKDKRVVLCINKQYYSLLEKQHAK